MKDLIALLLEYQREHSGGDPPQASTAAADASDDEVVSWREVKAFLAMAEHALLSKQHAAEGATRQAARQAEKEATAREESSFLEEVLGDLQAEKEALQSRVDVLAREKQILEREVALLREQVQAECSEQESPGAGQAAARSLQAELQAERQRNEVLEQQLLQVQARALALERAGRAQQTALISCMEEQERGWLAHSAHASAPTSPGGPVEWHAARSERTADDGSSQGGLEGEHSGVSLPASACSGQATPRTAGSTPFGSPLRRRAVAEPLQPTLEEGDGAGTKACAID